ncbi:hypothetical protein ACQ3G7_10415 [Kosakonia oryzendophytica]|uniref:hypothetical protein n=1 Tax=Kosakonia oryzendophytica TaxID=1005665 RepID=UPI003D339E92
MTVNSTGSQNRNAGCDFNENNTQMERFDARFCHINFGTGRFNDLTCPQLQTMLSSLDEENQTKPANKSEKIAQISQPG